MLPPTNRLSSTNASTTRLPRGGWEWPPATGSLLWSSSNPTPRPTLSAVRHAASADAARNRPGPAPAEASAGAPTAVPTLDRAASAPGGSGATLAPAVVPGMDDPEVRGTAPAPPQKPPLNFFSFRFP